MRPIYGYFPVRAVSSGDALNLIPQFATTATSSHPVIHSRSSTLPQPSLLANMLNLDGVTHGRPWERRFFAPIAIIATTIANSEEQDRVVPMGPSGLISGASL